MPFLHLSKKGDVPTYINMDHIVSIELISSESYPVVKITTTRAESDQSLECDSMEIAQGFIDSVLEYSKQIKTDNIQVAAETSAPQAKVRGVY